MPHSNNKDFPGLTFYASQCTYVMFRWISGEWTECSRTCGSGLRTRQVVCSRRVSAAGEAEVVDAVSCSGKRPKTKLRRCNEEAWPSAHWQTDDWSEVGDVSSHLA